MRAGNERHVAELAAAAQTGTLSRSDAVALFMHLRDESPYKSMLRDVGHSIAHDERIKGESFDYVKGYVAHIRDVFTNGGVFVVPVMFPIHELLDELATQLEAHDLSIDREAMHRHWEVLADLVADILDGVEYRVPAATARLRASYQHALDIEFDDGLVGGVITIPQGVVTSFPLLYERLNS